MALFNVSRYTGDVGQDPSVAFQNETVLDDYVKKMSMKERCISKRNYLDDCEADSVVSKKIKFDSTSEFSTTEKTLSMPVGRNQMKVSMKSGGESSGIVLLEEGKNSNKKLCQEHDESSSKNETVNSSKDQICKKNNPNDDKKGKTTSSSTNVPNMSSKLLSKVTFIEEGFKSDVTMRESGIKYQILLNNLHRCGYEYLFKVQTQVIPWLLRSLAGDHTIRQDLCVQAPPGSGKTLSYLLPILQCLVTRFSPRVRAIIVVPVYELVVQLTTLTKRLCKGTKLRVGITKNTAIEKDLLVHKLSNSSYESRVDILISTPGHLIDHLDSTPGFSIADLEFLVIDEADRVLNDDKNFLHYLQKHIPQENSLQKPINLIQQEQTFRRPQILLFSATLLDNEAFIRKVNALHYPKVFGFTPLNFLSEKQMFLQSGVVNKFTFCETANKPLVVSEFLSMGWRRVVCFMKTNKEAFRLTFLLKYLHPEADVREITTHIRPFERERTIKDFSDGLVDMIITTDRMARGIDIVNIDYVILYTMSMHCENYIHRAGRTGRAGRNGTAVTLLSPFQLKVFKELLLSIGQNANELTVNPDKENLNIYKKALVELQKEIKDEHLKRLQKLKKDRKKNIKKPKRKNRTGKKRIKMETV